MWLLFSITIFLAAILLVSSGESSTSLASPSESTVLKTTQRVHERKKISNKSSLGLYTGKMLAPFLGAGLKLYSGVSKGSTGVKTVASGTYDMADGAFDVVKTSFGRLGGIFLNGKITQK